jgi:hypothetical protein
MARASGIWIVRRGAAICGVFTVKHEMVTYLEKQALTNIRVTRFQDALPQLGGEDVPIEGLLK